MLPRKFNSPLWFTDNELSELKGTTLHRATTLQVICTLSVALKHYNIFWKNCYVCIYYLVFKNGYLAAEIIRRPV